jgi:hypothetical protein
VGIQTDDINGHGARTDLPVLRERARPLREALFATPAESVRLLCEEAAAGVIELRVFGPKTERAIYTFNALEVCEQFQTAIEAKLLRAGFRKLATAERRRATAGV